MATLLIFTVPHTSTYYVCEERRLRFETKKQTLLYAHK